VFSGTRHHIGLATVVPEAGRRIEDEVDSSAVPAVLEAEEFRTARLVKIDVEGAEALVVEGLEPLLSAGRKDLEVMVEVNPTRLGRQGRTATEILDRFAAARFNPYRVDNDYRALSYLQTPEPTPLKRLEGPIEAETDIVFSREDSDVL
jgi:hypothetical protein